MSIKNRICIECVLCKEHAVFCMKNTTKQCTKNNNLHKEINSHYNYIIMFKEYSKVHTKKVNRLFIATSVLINYNARVYY